MILETKISIESKQHYLINNYQLIKFGFVNYYSQYILFIAQWLIISIFLYFITHYFMVRIFIVNAS